MKTISAAIASLLVQVSFALTPAQWRSQSIYQVLTDRFAPNNVSTAGSCKNLGAYCGGTWQGLIQHLPYIQGMGFTAVWISPVVSNIQVPGNKDGDSYHGYWANDIYAVNTNFGSAADLVALSKALHNRNMYLMVDVAPNHMAYPGPASSVDYSTLHPFSSSKYFHSYCPIDYGNETSVETCWLGDSNVELVDLRTEDQSVYSIYTTWIKSLVANYTIDGLRVDTARHVNHDFLTQFENASTVYNVGEVYQYDISYTCAFQQYISGVLNYPAFNLITPAFASVSNTTAINALYNGINSIKSQCKDSTLLGSFLENQDQPRFPSYTSDTALIRNAIAFAMLADGIPILYEGQELLYSGNGIAANREAIWPSGYPTNTAMYSFITTLNKARVLARKADPAGGYDTYKAFPIYSDGDTIAMRKGATGAQMLGLFTNRGSGGGQEQKVLPANNTNATAGQVFVDLIGCQTWTADSNGALTVTLNQGGVQVLLPKTALKGSGLCGQ